MFGDAEAAALDAAAAHAKAYRRGVGAAPVRARLSYAEALARFAEPMPVEGLAPEAVVEELVRRADGGILGMTSPNFHGWVIGASHPAGVAADWLTAAWGQNSAFAEPTPAAAAVEEVAAGWILDVLGLPAQAGVGFATGATMANFTCLAAARGALLAGAGWDVEARGLFGAPEVQVVVGGEAHSSVYLSLRLLGFGAERVHVAAADDQGRMRPDALRAVLKGIAEPVVVCLQAGNVCSGAFDPFADLVPLARERRAWVHVDGAFGLWACAAPEPGLSVLNEVVLNQVVLACGEGTEGDRLTRATLAAVQADGLCYPSHGRWRGREIIRVSVSAGPTTLADGTHSAEAIVAAWRRVCGAA